MNPANFEEVQSPSLTSQQEPTSKAQPINHYRHSIPMSGPMSGDRVNDRFSSLPKTRDRNAAAKTLMDLGWTFDEVVAVLKMEGDRDGIV